MAKKQKKTTDSLVDRAIDLILQHEGGYSNHPADRGGETQFGITATLLKDLKKNIAVKDVTKQLARTLYEDFIRKYRIDQLPGKLVVFMADLCVLVGPHRGICLLQARLNASFKAGLKVDGVIGPKTIAAAGQVDIELLVKLLTGDVINVHVNCTMANPSQRVFIRGWINRAESRLRATLGVEE